MIGVSFAKRALPVIARHWKGLLIAGLLLSIMGQWKLIEHKNQKIFALSVSVKTLNSQVQQYSAQQEALQRMRKQLYEESLALQQDIKLKNIVIGERTHDILNTPLKNNAKSAMDYLIYQIDALDWMGP